jgi:hypothetical protein
MEERIGGQMFDEGEVKLYRTVWRCCTAFAKNDYKETTLPGSSAHGWTK